MKRLDHSTVRPFCFALFRLYSPVLTDRSQLGAHTETISDSCIRAFAEQSDSKDYEMIRGAQAQILCI